jgi:periplasmic protein TonB
MAPSTHVETLPEPGVREKQSLETLVLENRETQDVITRSINKKEGLEEGSFRSSMIEFNRMRSTSRMLDTLISLAVNLAVIAGPVFAGLYFTDTINLKQLESTFLVAPPPPPPPPPAPTAVVVRAAPVRRVFENAGKLIAPIVIPKSVADIKEAPLPPDMNAGGVAGGVPGGVAGGSMGGVIGGVIGGINTAVPMVLLAPKEKPRAPIRVGGRVKEPRLISRVDPVYPPLARQTHVQGTVLIEAVLDEQGNVVEAKVASGPPLLIQAALDAVRKWKYEPTYLNDQPVAVQLNVTVMFTLNQ